MASVREIAARAGVSKSTVSLVLNNKPGVSAQMRNAVLQAVQELDEQPTRKKNDTTTFGTKKRTIAVFHPPVLRSSYVFKEVLHGIQTAATEHNVELRLVINELNSSPQHVSNLYLSDPSLRPDGILVFHAQQNEPLIDIAKRLGIPCVALGLDIQNYDVSGIGRHETRHAREATEHLLQLGHRAIGFVGGDATYDYAHTRLAGYRQALAAQSIEPNGRWVALGNGYNALETILRDAPEVTALLFVNDTYANEALPLIQKMGLRVPEDLSIVSFDNTDIARNFVPPLTSISYNQFAEGQWAVQLLLNQIETPYLQQSQVIFGAELIVRDSCTAVQTATQKEAGTPA